MSNNNNIGYKKPPVKNQFKKGQSGNKNGRPKGSKNIFNLLDMELNQKIILNDRNKFTKAQVIAKQIVNGAVKGEPKKTEMLFKYSDKKQFGNGSLSDKFMHKFISDGYTTMEYINDYINGYSKDLFILKDTEIIIDLSEDDED